MKNEDEEDRIRDEEDKKIVQAQVFEELKTALKYTREETFAIPLHRVAQAINEVFDGPERESLAGMISSLGKIQQYD